MADSVVKICDNDRGISEIDSRENYNKIVIHKPMWIPVTEDLSLHSDSDHEGDRSANMQRTQPARCSNKRIRNIPAHGKPALPPKPPVLRKPVFSKFLGMHQIPEMQRKMQSTSDHIMVLNGSNYKTEHWSGIQNKKMEEEINEGKERNLQRQGINSVQKLPINTNEIKKNVDRGKHLREQKDELMNRMQKKVNILKDETGDLQTEESEVNDALDTIISTVDAHGSMSDVDKLKVHINELESVTRLITVLSVRLETAENKIELTRDVTEKAVLQNKKLKLSTQLEEAAKLKEFRTRRGESIYRQLRGYLDADTLVQLTELLFLKVKLISELCKLEEKIQLGEHRISALENTGTLN